MSSSDAPSAELASPHPGVAVVAADGLPIDLDNEARLECDDRDISPDAANAKFDRHMVSARRSLLGGRLEVLAKDSGMARGDSKKAERRPFWPTPTLLPVPERVDADSHRLREGLLSQTDESTKGGYVLSALELPTHEPLAHSVWNRPGEVGF